MDLVLRGCRIVDGTGRPAFEGSVAVEDGLIREVGDVGRAGAGAEELDLEGLVLTPGFIDTHTHYDAQVFWDPDLTPSSWNGVTSVVMANCGFGIAPAAAEHRELLVKTLERVEGMPAEVLRAGIPWTWETWPEFFDAVAARPKRVNVGVFCGHSALRFFVMGEAAQDRRATADEVDQMCRLLRGALEHGAIGLATTVRPTATGAYGKPIPSILADNAEVEALASVLGEVGRGVIAITHGPGKEDFWVDEFGELARRTGRPVAWAPLLTGEYGGKGKGLEILDWARSQDTELYTQFSCLPTSTQYCWLRPGTFGARHPAIKEIAELSAADKMQRMAQPAWRDQLEADVAAEPRSHGIFERMWVAESPSHPELQGERIAELAQRTGRRPSDVWIDVALDDDLETKFDLHIGNLDEEDLGAQLADPTTMVTLSDAGAHPGELCDAGYPAHLLGHWTREVGAISLEQAIWKLTGQPASAYRVEGRGVIAPGKVADLVAFDPDTIGPAERHRLWDLPTGAGRLVVGAEGIHHMWVAGVRTMEDGELVPGTHPATMLRGEGERIAAHATSG